MITRRRPLMLRLAWQVVRLSLLLLGVLLSVMLLPSSAWSATGEPVGSTVSVVARYGVGAAFVVVGGLGAMWFAYDARSRRV